MRTQVVALNLFRENLGIFSWTCAETRNAVEMMGILSLSADRYDIVIAPLSALILTFGCLEISLYFIGKPFLDVARTLPMTPFLLRFTTTNVYLERRKDTSKNRNFT